MTDLKELKYSSMSMFLHWLIALLVLGMLSVGFFMGDVPDDFKPMVYMFHKSIGISVFFLMILRIVWILYAGKPELPDSTPVWELALARLVQYGFYLLLIVMPLTGWIMSTAAGRSPVFFGLFQLPFPWIGKDDYLVEFMGGWHETIAWILIVLIILHVLGALKHQLIDKNDIMKSMMPRRRRS